MTDVCLITCYNTGSEVPARSCRSRRRGTRMEVRMLGDSSVLSPAPEEWRPVVGFEGRYDVSDQGRLRSLSVRRNGRNYPRSVPRMVQPSSHPTGYRTVALNGTGRRFHRLVLMAFVGPCPVGMQAAHLNGVKDDNRLVNLAWKTPRDNNHDKVDHGTMLSGDEHYARRYPERLARGERHGRTRLTENDVRGIRAAIAGGKTRMDVAQRYGVATTTVGDIARRRVWGHVL